MLEGVGQQVVENGIALLGSDRHPGRSRVFEKEFDTRFAEAIEPPCLCSLEYGVQLNRARRHHWRRRRKQ